MSHESASRLLRRARNPSFQQRHGVMMTHLRLVTMSARQQVNSWTNRHHAVTGTHVGAWWPNWQACLKFLFKFLNIISVHARTSSWTTGGAEVRLDIH